MSTRNIRIVAAAVALATFLALLISVFPAHAPKTTANIPSTTAVDFRHNLASGTIIANGTYAVYSLGNPVDPTSIGLPKGTPSRWVEFPLQTKDGRTVYGMFFITGTVTNKDVISEVFTYNGKFRNVLTKYIPAYMRSKMEDEVSKYSYTAFGVENTAVRTQMTIDLANGLKPVFTDLGFKPVEFAVLVYQH